MARTAAPERPNPFLTRCNLEPSTRLHEVVEPAVSRPELAFRIAVGELLGNVAEAIARIERGDGADAALRELWAALLEVKATCHSPIDKSLVVPVRDVTSALSN